MNRSPVLLAVKSERFTWVRARVAAVPLTYSCRVSIPAPTFACQMFRPELARLQPVICRAPLMTGCADGAACHTTVCPLVPESAAVNRSGDDSR